MSDKEIKPEFVFEATGYIVTLKVFMFFLCLDIILFLCSLIDRDVENLGVAIVQGGFVFCVCSLIFPFAKKVEIFATHIRMENFFYTKNININSIKKVVVTEKKRIKIVIIADKKYSLSSYEKEYVDNLIKKLRDKGVIAEINGENNYTPSENAIREKDISYRRCEIVSTTGAQSNNSNRNTTPNSAIGNTRRARENTGRRRVVANKTVANDDSQDTQQIPAPKGRRIEL